ncbi:uncharacterized protein J4E79_007162 [Alternaria viburni]|uniref:uncharacterized protein n=1 Tax=Alternaria viburni TaxID=566460 RepID=UPI0020C4E21F|nr:uncharacterized protein J4E79_007162 [Alternaria viburni]KAI4658180.1 hypothetical protein J4E79_007162 [Alternaria viburni]
MIGRRQSGTFVARGAVLAAGSAATITGWKAHVNIGMLRQICYQDLDGDTALALKDIPRELDPDSQDGTELIRNVPTWIIRQDREYSSTERFPDIDSIHIWYEDEAKWALDETFVALVGVASDHLPITDKKNNGSFHAYTGYIEKSADI